MKLKNTFLDGLSDEEFCRLFGKKYAEFIASQKDEDYEINPPQWLKMVRILKLFYELAESSNGRIEPCEVSPRTVHGGVTAYFNVLDIMDGDIAKFCEALQKSSAVTIDATLDGQVCVSVSVPDVFVKRK